MVPLVVTVRHSGRTLAGRDEAGDSRDARIARVIDVLRQMPAGVRVVLAFGFVLLSAIGLTLPLIINQAVEAPVSPVGLLWMLLLAYLVFTLTLILQRKQAGWLLSLGLATLSVPIALILFQWAGVVGALAGVLLIGVLFLALRGQRARAWFSEP
jgi:hypothetical protein